MAGTPPASSLLGPGELKKQNNLLLLHINDRPRSSTPLHLPSCQPPSSRSSASSCWSWICLCCCTSCSRALHNPIRSSQFNYVLGEKILPPPSAQCFYPVISLGALCSIPQLSPELGRSCQAFAVPKCLAELLERGQLQVGSLSPGTSASPQLSTSAHLGGKAWQKSSQLLSFSLGRAGILS